MSLWTVRGLTVYQNLGIIISERNRMVIKHPHLQKTSKDIIYIYTNELKNTSILFLISFNPFLVFFPD